jgi:hypothetical protein
LPKQASSKLPALENGASSILPISSESQLENPSAFSSFLRRKGAKQVHGRNPGQPILSKFNGQFVPNNRDVRTLPLFTETHLTISQALRLGPGAQFELVTRFATHYDPTTNNYVVTTVCFFRPISPSPHITMQEIANLLTSG